MKRGRGRKYGEIAARFVPSNAKQSGGWAIQRAELASPGAARPGLFRVARKDECISTA